MRSPEWYLIKGLKSNSPEKLCTPRGSTSAIRDPYYLFSSDRDCRSILGLENRQIKKPGEVPGLWKMEGYSYLISVLIRLLVLGISSHR